jgi:hypothetical protein
MLPQLSNGQLIKLNGYWKFAIGDQQSWSNSDFDDSTWGEIKVPSFWENQGFHGYDGFAWYRTSFDGKNLPKNERLFLNMGYIDDTDEVYFNGQLIGFSGSMPPNFRTAYNAERSYIIPQNLINFNGRNVISVRVFDAIQGGGIIDGNIGVYKVSSGSPMLLDLQGIWEFQTSTDGSRPKKDAKWNKIIVPSFWEKQGYRKYDGYGWYRKEFMLTPDMANEELVLVLGKIDDFDEVFINGKLAGKTRDNRRFGQSESYAKLRAYYIPQVLLKTDENNVIEILVEDIGWDGGIYEGPIGITTKKLFEKNF